MKKEAKKAVEKVQGIAEKVPGTLLLDVEPKAEIIIKGIGLLWFSKKSSINSAVVGFLNIVKDELKHDLLVSIRRKNGSLHKIEVPKNSKVVFNSKNTGRGRILRSGDERDFKHILDLTKIHGLGGTVKEKFFAKFFINNATFYTAQMSKKTVILNEIGGNGIRKDLPRIGKVAGALIYDEDFDIRINDESPLPLTDYKKPYEITLQYQCPREFERGSKSDFKFVYNAVEVADRRMYNLKYNGDEPVEFTVSEAESARRFLNRLEKKLSRKINISAKDVEKILEEVKKLNQRISCEVACQLVTFGEEPI